MVDKIVKLGNNQEFLILDQTELDDNVYYLGIMVDKNEEPMNVHMFFKEQKKGNKTLLVPVMEEKERNLLLTSFTINYLDMTSIGEV